MAKERKKWTIEAIKADALKYQTRREWKIKSNAYQIAQRRHILDECCGHMTELCHKWTDEELKADALKYQSRREWQVKSNNAYDRALRRNILDECCGHMTALHHYWTDCEIMADALRYRTRQEWKAKSKKAYDASHNRDITDECCSHMPVHSSISHSEQDLLKIIQQTYPKAQKIRLGRLIKGQYGTSFELDIYVPELRKGIEFDGTYWHSPKGLRRGRPNWPEDMIQNYCSLKRDFFIKRGIEYLSISEFDWFQDKDKTLERIQAFLTSDNDSI